MISSTVIISGILAITHVAADCSAAKSIFVFDPPSLDYQATIAGAQFTVTLASAPNQTFEAGLNLDGFMFDTPKLSFTADNWNKSQTVTVMAEPDLAVPDGQHGFKVVASINAPCMPHLHRCNANYGIQYTHSPGLHCTIVGDPQVHTFDGTGYTQVDAGSFYFVKNDYLEVQGFLYNCDDGIVCLGAVSVRYGDSVLLIDGDHTPDGNGVVKKVSDSLNGLTYTPTGNSDNGGRFTIGTFQTADGSKIVVDNDLWEHAPHMNVDITLSPFFRNVESTGQCANTPGNIQTWPVASENQHIHKHYVAGILRDPLVKHNLDPTKPLRAGMTFNETTYADICVIQVIQPPVVIVQPPVDPCIVPYTPPSFVPPTVITNASAPVAVFNPAAYMAADLVNAQNQCQQILSAEKCEQLPTANAAFFLDACIKDYLLSSSHRFSEGHRQMLHVRCAAACQAVVNSPAPVQTLVQPAAALQLQNGYGQNLCPNSCSGNGVCSAVGCACAAGFSGVNCSVNLATLPCPAKQPVSQGIVYVAAPAPSAPLVQPSVQVAVQAAQAGSPVPVQAIPNTVAAPAAAIAVVPATAAAVYSQQPAAVAATVVAAATQPAVYNQAPVPIAGSAAAPAVQMYTQPAAVVAPVYSQHAAAVAPVSTPPMVPYAPATAAPAASKPLLYSSADRNSIAALISSIIISLL
ncbi:hypothetical protein BC830DRAFT_1085576 [Chytriomyces sp. MP71]|nr:hypothetical protein BC830DRAFT_1085576 [Chytriomyces sp. MP71]